jgi:tetratricopeptide (TPR) repeat protein
LVSEGVSRLVGDRQRNRIPAVLAALGLFSLVAGASTWSYLAAWTDDVTLWSRVIELDPTSQRAYSQRGLARMLKGQDDLAAKDLDQAIALGKKDFRAYNNRGRLRLKRGDLAGAAEDFRRSLDLAPRSARRWINFASALRGLGKTRGTIEACDRALKLDPRQVDAYVLRGLAYAERGQLGTAARDFGRALALAPPDWPQRTAVRAMVRQARQRR